ncbi:MAG TPA: hypothetical protein VLN91_08295, partial [Nitrospirota bacterium]|nr:hypothetical protein [Nitrospirota bacterium]
EREEKRQRVPERERLRTVAPDTRHAAPGAPTTARPEKEEQLPRALPRTPEQRLPPERVRRTNPEEMKQERRLVKERESSVFRPQQPENMPVRKSHEPREIKRGPTQPQQPRVQGQKQNHGERREGPPQR